MKKIESLFIGVGLVAVIAVLGGGMWSYFSAPQTPAQIEVPDSRFGNFLAAQHAVYVNDFDNAMRFTESLSETQYQTVLNTKMISEFLSGNMPKDAALLEEEKNAAARIIYDAYLVGQGKWKELHNRHKTDTVAMSSPLRIWSAIANDWRSNTFKFIDGLPTNDSWKSFVRGQIYAELGEHDKATEQFDNVNTDFMNINDYLYIMSFYTHHDMPEKADGLKRDFTARPGGMFMHKYDNIPDWSLYQGYANQLAFNMLQTVSHTQIMMYSDLAMLFLRFAQITAPEFSKNNDALNYYIGQFFFNNIGDWKGQFDKISADSPFFLFAQLRKAEKSGDMAKLNKIMKNHPLFVPAANVLIGHYIKTDDRRAALRVVNRALRDENINDYGTAFFLKSRAQIHFAFGNLNSAQSDLNAASSITFPDAEILSLQAKIWALQNREIENAYDYAMSLVKQNPTDVLAWDTLATVIHAREGVDAALEVLERVGEVSATCSSLFEQLGDLYSEKEQNDKARDAYLRAIELSDDGLVVVPFIERKIRNLK